MTKYKPSKVTSLGLVFSLLLASGCGSALQKQLKDEDGNSSPGELIPFALTVEQDEVAGGLGLLQASTPDFVIEITSCSSAYTTTVTSTTGSPEGTVLLYKYDTDCVAELHEFDWLAKNWTKQGGGTLSSGSAIFVDGTGEELNVTVLQNLASPLVDGGAATFIFQEIIKGSDFVVTDYTFSETLEVVGLEAPNVKINFVDLTAIASGTGIPTFTVSVECNIAVSGVDDELCQTPGGIDQDMRNYKIAVVYDDPIDYNGVLSYSQATDIITANGVAVLTAHLDPTVGLNGGFARPAIVMNEGPLFNKKEMLIVVEFSDPDIIGARSYRYFSATIGDP